MLIFLTQFFDMLKKDKKINIFIAGNYSCYLNGIDEKVFVFDFLIFYYPIWLITF